MMCGKPLRFLVAAVAVALSGCGQGTSDREVKTQPDAVQTATGIRAQITITLNDEIAKAIAEIKGSEVKPLPAFKAPSHLLYPTQRDKDGVQFWIAGNHAREVIEILSSTYGPPKLIQTNKEGWINAAYTEAQTGAAVSFFTGESEGNQYTHLIITKPPPLLF